MPFWESQQSLTILQWVLRGAVAYGYLLFLTKLMGQREVGRLTLFDFTISIVIGSILASPLASSTSSFLGPAITLATLAFLQILISFVALRFSKTRRVLEEEPIILVQNGQLLEKAMKRTRINLDDLMSQLRQKNYFYLHQVEFAVLEPNGKISVLPKSQYRPATPTDLNIKTNYEGYPSMLIEDGNVLSENLKKIDLSENWLLDQLKINNISSPREVLAAMLDTQGRLYFSLKNQAEERLKSEPAI
ncbi:MAG: DUF421 domain-containing protein [Firmicutes bacterium]|nr:DUF421 domain-containing protein [Bacillota bacterium]